MPITYFIIEAGGFKLRIFGLLVTLLAVKEVYFLQSFFKWNCEFNLSLFDVI